MRKISTISVIVFMIINLVGCNFQGGNPPKADGNLNIKLMIGRDKQWIFDSVQTILDNKNFSIKGKKIKIVTEKAGTGEAMDKILDPKTDYIGWMPASSTHIAWANDTWLKRGNTTKLIDDGFSTVFLTPTVLAMPESLAKIMGYPNKKLGWSDILALSTAKDGWGSYGKSILNPVRFAHTHPAKSNSGLNAIIAVEYAFSNKQKGLSVEDVKTNSSKLKEVEKTIVHYGESTSLLQSKIAEKGTTFIQYAVLYEYMVADLNNKKTSKEKIVSIYPKEGTIWGDVCFANVGRNIKNDDQRAALLEISKILLSDEIQKKGMEEYFFRSSNVNIPLSSKLSPELGVEPKEPQTTLELPSLDVINAILEDWSINMKKRANVVFDIDVSGSMSGVALDTMKEAVKNLLNPDVKASNYNNVDKEDTLSLITFNNKVSDIYTIKGDNINEMRSVVDNLAANGGTALYDSIMRSYGDIEKIKTKENSDKIDMLVVLTDGRDTASQTKIDALMNFIGSKEGTLPTTIVIGYGDVDEEVLKGIADKTGGKYYKGDPNSIKQVFEEIKTFF